MQKVEFKHTRNTSSILLYDIENDYLRAAFLTKNKPKVGDLFQTFTKADTNFVYTFKIIEIITVEDSKSDAKNTENALIEAKIEMLNVVMGNGVVSGELLDGLEVVADIRRFY